MNKDGTSRFQGSEDLHTTQFAPEIWNAYGPSIKYYIYAYNMNICCIPVWACPVLLRQYPPGFGCSLLQLYDESKGRPQFDLRQKVAINPQRTDLQIFQGLPNHDCWVDAKLPTLFLYLFENENLRIPDEWTATMQSMYLDMKKLVTWLQ